MLTGDSDNRRRMRWYGSAIVVIAAQLAWSMPTKDEIKRVEPLMNELMSAYLKGYTANRKTANEVGDAAFHFVKDARGEASKYVLLKGAIHYYSLARDFDKAADALEAMRAQISDLPPDEVESIASRALARAGNARALRLRNIQRVASEQVKALIDISACKKELRKNPDDTTAMRGLAKAYVRFGDWPRALKVFSKLGIEAAIYECNPEDAKEYNAMKAADYWWGCSAKNPAPYRAHAAELYRRAIKDGLVTGLMTTIVENRIAEVESSGGSMSILSSSRAVSDSVLRNGACRKLTLPGGVKMEMIYVAPGSFMMGSPKSEDGDSDETQHRVTLTKGYWLGKYEVTQRQWESMMGDNPSRFQSDNRPVENVSWTDCQRFITQVDALTRSQLGGEARLPTEAEWEYACRAGTTTAYSWGNALNGDKANCDGSHPYGTTTKGRCRKSTSNVGSYSPNAWGFYDMHGNVHEWCNDLFGSYGGDATNPSGAASGRGRVLRGGSCNSSAKGCRSADRFWDRPGSRIHMWGSIYGFRLCCSAGPREGSEER